MRVLVFGPGVVGSYYAARLRNGGHQVAVMARGLRLAQIRQHGIVLEDAATHERSVHRILALDHFRPGEAYDLVLVAVRKNQLSAVLPALASNWALERILVMGNSAAGLEELDAALGPGRAFWGFPGVVGRREGHVIHYMALARGRLFPTILGEIEGPPSGRLTELAAVFESAGLPVSFCAQMDAWLKTHVALVLPLALAIYAAGGSVCRMTHTRDALLLAVRGMREGLMALRALEIPVVPGRVDILSRVPEPLLVELARARLHTALAEFALEAHANAARDEMAHLAAEFRGLLTGAGVVAPSLDLLYAHLDPKTPALEEGRRRIPLDWGPLLRLAAPLVVLVLGVGAARLRRRSRMGR